MKLLEYVAAQSEVVGRVNAKFNTLSNSHKWATVVSKLCGHSDLMMTVNMYSFF